jgi:hypothetical protein
MSDRCPADRPVDVSYFRSINISGGVEIFFDPLLSFENNLIGDKGVDNKTRYNAHEAGDG